MPWARVGDNAASYPRLMQIAGFPGATAGTVNEVFGFLMRCATLSAGHLTDYVIDVGTAHMIGGARTKKLLGWCEQAGLLTPLVADGVDGDSGGVVRWVILNDPDFIHIRTAAEVEWERQRKADNRDPALMVQIRRRDGDNCRYCGVLVHWTGRKSNRSAQPDHREPGKAGTVETMVVACLRCNTQRQDSEQWDADHPLLPVPASPNYGKSTAAFLSANGYPTEPNITPDMLTASSADTAALPARPAAPHEHPTPAPAGADTAAEGATRSRREPPGWASETPANLAGISGSSPTDSPDRTGFVGSGRDGSGSDYRPRRRRRGARGRGRPAGHQSSGTEGGPGV